MAQPVEVPYLIMEFINGSMLYDYLDKEGMPEDICLYLFRQILQGIHFIHSKGVVHLDLKAENIMFDEEDCMVKLIDFGYA